MVKYGKKVILHTGGLKSDPGYVGKGCRGVTVSKSGKRYNCRNKIYGAVRGGKKGKGIPKDYCKKHFEANLPKDWKINTDREKKRFVYTKKELDEKFNKNQIPVCQEKACVSIGYKSINDVVFCRRHYRPNKK